MNVVIAGSTETPLTSIGKVLEILIQEMSRNNPKPPRILLRRGLHSAISPFEAYVAELARLSGLEVQWCYPDRRGGREGTYVRDAHMVQMADHVIAFFTPETLMAGGTGHVVQKALDKEIPVSAYEVDEDGLRWVGGG